MSDNLHRKCLKCGVSPHDDPNIKLHRFPKPGSTNIRRCEMWAKYCFPDKSWSSQDFQRKLYSEHRMLCNRHFKDTEFINIEEKKLSKHAVPDISDFDKENEAHAMKKQSYLNYNLQDLIDQHHDISELPESVMPKPGSSRVLIDTTNENYQKLISTVQMVTTVTANPDSLIENPTKQQKHHDTFELPETLMPKPGPSRVLIDTTNEHYQKLISTVQMVTTVTPNPDSLIENPTKQQKINTKVSLQPTKKAKDMTLYLKCRKQTKKICYLQKRLKKFNRKDTLNVLVDNENVKKLMGMLTPAFSLMLQGQLRNIKRKHSGRRWTLEEKIIALRLFKRSGTCYRLLQRLWCLPATSTLKTLLGKFPLNTGLNDNIFRALKNHVSKQIPSDNEYILMFDEMAIRKNLWYNYKSDKIIGYQDHGSQGTTQQEATYALVFMVAGIRKKYKQPVAFYLSGANVTSDRLAVLIKEVLNKCFEIGMSVTATVCDMDGVNRRALTILGASKDQPCFTFNDKNIVALFDSPHLLKCFRNLFLKYDLKCPTDITSNNTKGEGIAKWSHIQHFFEVDNINPNFVFAPTLRKDHINPNNKQKMKVNLAAQVLSHSVAAGMFAKISQGELPGDATVTADVVSKMDKLFDAVNSDTSDLRRGKPYATNLKTTSPHLKFFQEMISFFQNLEFLGCRSIPPSRDGWIWTLNGIIKIFETLKQKHGIKSLATRRIQQDPLENLFGCIRANCGANTNPTAIQFIGGLKTAIISNLAHMQSGSNCEADNFQSIMSDFKSIFSSQTHTTYQDVTHEVLDMLSEGDHCFDKSLTDTAEMQACAYVCGFILKKLNMTCDTCEVILRAGNVHDNIQIFLEYKEYDDIKKKLMYASTNLIKCVEECATICNNYFLTSSSMPNLKERLLKKMYNEIDFSFFFKCKEHAKNNLEIVCTTVFHICVKRYCVLKNRDFTEGVSKTLLKKKIDILKHK